VPNLTSERLTGVIVGFAAVGVLLTGWLVLSELFREPTCPELIGVPACYVVLAGYLAALVGAWFPGTKRGDAVFLVGAGVVTAIGTWFSFLQLTGGAQCPTFEGLPMCFVSLFAGASMLAVDQLRRRVSQPSGSTAC
jgi:hypothetical protein